jgi:hypothetical protein
VPESFKASTGTFIFLNDLFQLFLVGISRHIVFCHGRFLDSQKKKNDASLLSEQKNSSEKDLSSFSEFESNRCSFYCRFATGVMA